MFAVAMTVVIGTMALALVRAGLGPTVFDRILAANMFGTKTVLLIAVISFMTGRADFIDLALVYALLNFIGVIAVLRFLKIGDFTGRDEPRGDAAGGGEPPC